MLTLESMRSSGLPDVFRSGLPSNKLQLMVISKLCTNIQADISLVLASKASRNFSPKITKFVILSQKIPLPDSTITASNSHFRATLDKFDKLAAVCKVWLPGKNINVDPSVKYFSACSIMYWCKSRHGSPGQSLDEEFVLT